MSEKKICDNTSVGVIALDDQGRILLVERRKFPTEILWRAKAPLQETSPSFGWAPPFGHCDDCNYGSAAFREFEEKTGLQIVGAPMPLIPKNPRKNLKCRRGGQYHDWQIFEVNWKGILKPNHDEIINAKWHTSEEIRKLAENTSNLISPGLELVWCQFFRELTII